MKVKLTNSRLVFAKAISLTQLVPTSTDNGLVSGNGTINTSLQNWTYNVFDVSQISNIVSIKTQFASGSARVWILKNNNNVVSSGSLIETSTVTEEEVTNIDVSGGDTLIVNCYNSTTYPYSPEVMVVASSN